MFGAIGSMGQANNWVTAQYVAAHAVAGCISSETSGGTCGSGALAAGFAKLATMQLPNSLDVIQRGVASVIIGGTASVLGGGKFENGAATAAFGYVFNFLSHVHMDLTYQAARAAGLGFLDSIRLANMVAGVDFEGAKLGGLTVVRFESQDIEHAYMHGMCAAGSSSALCDLRVVDYKERMWNLKSSAGLAGLLHVAQDEYAPGHKNLATYNGSVGFQHLDGDRSPPANVARAIVDRSTQLIKNYLRSCPQCF